MKDKNENVLIENPVLQRELLVNLRMTRAFVLLLIYIALLGLVVYVAWPSQARLDLRTARRKRKRLVDLFFLGQYALLSLMVPSFAAGTITGEKERQTYEMLLASPMRPAAVVLGKLLAALCHLARAGLLLAADRHALPAAGRRVALRSAGDLRRHGGLRDALRHDLRGGQQLLHPHHRGPGGFLPGDPAAGPGGNPVLRATGRLTGGW